MNYTIENVNISTISAGDTIEHCGEIVTVGKNNIKYCNFMGYTIFGDSYKLGYQLVKKVIIHKA
jgi:hypothetical protein